jgi:hypothetical protein
VDKGRHIHTNALISTWAGFVSFVADFDCAVGAYCVISNGGAAQERFAQAGWSGSAAAWTTREGKWPSLAKILVSADVMSGDCLLQIAD